MEIPVREVIHSPLAMLDSQGQALHGVIVPFLDRDLQVHLSFAGIEDVDSVFLNAAIGQLYGRFSRSFLNTHLSVTGLDRDGMALLLRVTAATRLYFYGRELTDERNGPHDGALQRA